MMEYLEKFPQKLKDKIVSLPREDGWHDGEGKGVTDDVRKFLCSFLHEVFAVGLDNPCIGPTDEGGVNLLFENYECYLELDGSLEVLCRKTNDWRSFTKDQFGVAARFMKHSEFNE